jgi:hypothetical protein
MEAMMGVENYQFIENLEYDVDSVLNKFVRRYSA